MNMIATVIGFGVIVTIIIFVCICGRIRATESIASAPTAFAAESGSEQEHNGLDHVIIAAFPTMEFRRDAGSREDAQCSICLREYQDKEVLRIMPACGHSFHVSCIDTWLQQRSTCPVCRSELRDSVVGTKHSISPMLSAILEWLLHWLFLYQWLLRLLRNQVPSSDAESNQEHRLSVPTNAQDAEAGR